MIEIIEQAIAAHNAVVIKRAETAEKQLVIAEKALIEKDEQIAILKRVLDKRDAKIKSFEEQLTNQISTVIADAEKDKKIKELEECNKTLQHFNKCWKQLCIEKKAKIEELEKHLTIAKNVNEQWKNAHIADSVRITKLEQTIKKYTSTLKNIEGTLCAASDHFKEVSNFIHTIVK